MPKRNGKAQKSVGRKKNLQKQRLKNNGKTSQ